MTMVLPAIELAEMADRVANILRPCTDAEADTVVRVASGIALNRRATQPIPGAGMAKYQTTPFKININGYGVFEAVASEGVIRPKYKKALRTMYDPSVRDSVETFAQFYLKRRDWKWEIPDEMPEL